MQIQPSFRGFSATWRPSGHLGIFVMFQDPRHAPIAPGDFMPADAMRSAFAGGVIQGHGQAPASWARPRRWFVLAVSHRIQQTPDGPVRTSRAMARLVARAGAKAWLVLPGAAPGLGGGQCLVADEPGAMPGQPWGPGPGLGLARLG